jgi:hypothetical protein
MGKIVARDEDAPRCTIALGFNACASTHTYKISGLALKLLA